MKPKQSSTEKSGLEKFRREIDGLDGRILGLLNERARAVQKIGSRKKERNQDVYSSGREYEILDRLRGANRGPLPPEAVDEIFHAVINNCRLLQKRLVVAYFGPEATFTHQAALKHFGQSAEARPFKTIGDVFDEVEKGRADYGVVPIENSTEGVVNHTLDMFMESDLVICAEREDPVVQCLLGSQESLKGVKAVYSHPQALAQSRRWLDQNLRDVPIHEAASTADAAARAALEPQVAAVASVLAAEIYHLKILAKNIQNTANNMTRFLIIGRTVGAPLGSGRDKTSLLLSVKDRVGALHDLLGAFKEAEVNLTKIESRPTKKRPWEYVFFLDLEGHGTDEKVKKVLASLGEHCAFLKILGSYPRSG
jgi:chorismate mutase/prephenate dehydratase